MNHAETLISGVACGPRRDRMANLVVQVTPDHFPDGPLRSMWTLLVRYYDLTSAILPPDTFEDLLKRQGIKDDRLVTYAALYRRLASTPVEDHAVRYAVDAIRDAMSLHRTKEMLNTAHEILGEGATVGKEALQGHRDARRFMHATLAEIDGLDNTESAPEGDIRHDADDVLQEYASRKEGKHRSGIFTGIPQIDTTTFGFEAGELILVTAYTGEGKTQFCCQTAWHAAVTQGKNVCYMTSETLRGQVRRRIVSRHSRMEHFGLANGLNSRDIKHGTLDAAGERALQDVVHDLGTNPNYGYLNVVQIPRGAPLSFIEGRARRIYAREPFDLLVVDYLNLVSSDRHRLSSREEANDVIKGGKGIATTIGEGRGVPLISPWQMKQESRTSAGKTGEYTLASLSETSEAEKSADVILSMLRLPDTPREVKFQFLKTRDADAPPPFTLDIDYATSYMAPKATNAADALLEDD